MRRLIGACLALAAISLLLPSVPSYDPWAWIVWGREVFQLDLDTSGGPSWKPGPVLLTTLFAPLEGLDEGLPPALWLVVARAGGLLALALAFRVARRLTGEGWAGIAAGCVAAVAVLTLPLWLRYMAHGNEAPLAVALMLWAVERHLDGRRVHSLILLFAACLLRPEVFPFMAVEAALVFYSQPRARWLVAGLFLALPVLWLVPEWIGSGNPLDAGKQASSEPPWSLSLKEKPWLAALERADGLAGLDLELAALAGVLWAAVRRQRAALVLAATGVLWLALILVMTGWGFSGASRYFLPPLVIACLLAGYGVGQTLEGGAQLARAAARRVRVPAAGARTAAAAAALGVAAVLAVLAAPFADDRARGLDDQLRGAERRVENQNDLAAAVDRLAGANGSFPGGTPWVPRAFHARFAWEAGIHMAPIEEAAGEALGRRLVFRMRGHRVPPNTRVKEQFGRWRVMRARRAPVAGRPVAKPL